MSLCHWYLDIEDILQKYCDNTYSPQWLSGEKVWHLITDRHLFVVLYPTSGIANGLPQYVFCY